MRAKSAKAKGRRLQDQVAEDIVQQLGFPEEAVRGAIMGESGCDIKIAYNLRKEFPYSIECKNRERLNIWEAILQTIENRVQGTVPILVIKKNRREAWAALPWSDFLIMVRELHELRRKK